MVVHEMQKRMYKLSAKTTVRELKELITRAQEIDAKALDLTYNGEILADDQMFLEKYFQCHNTCHEVLLIKR